MPPITPIFRKLSEADIRRAIEKALNASRLVHVWKNAQFHGMTPSGWIDAGLCTGSADLVGITAKGRFFAIEVKTPKGKRSPEQIAWAEFVTKWGGYVGEARSAEEAMEHARKANEI